MSKVPAALIERPPTDPINVLNSWEGMAWDRFNGNGSPALRDFYEGYAMAIGDVIRLLKANAKEAVEEVANSETVEEVVKHGHKFRTLVIVAIGVGGYVVYKKRKEEREKLQKEV